MPSCLLITATALLQFRASVSRSFVGGDCHRGLAQAVQPVRTSIAVRLATAARSPPLDDGLSAAVVGASLVQSTDRGERARKSQIGVSTRIATVRDMDLTTTYSGLRLPHPLVCGASPLSADLDMILRLEDAGAAAVVMHSLFEEQILKDAMRRPHLGRDSRTRVSGHASLPLNAYAMAPGEYLEHLLRVKARVGIPIIASLNGTTPEGWLQVPHAPSNARVPMHWN